MIVAVTVGVRVGVVLGVMVRVVVGVKVAVAVVVAVGVRLWVGVLDGVLVTVEGTTGVGVGDEVGVEVAVDADVLVADGVRVRVGVADDVRLGDRVGVGLVHSTGWYVTPSYTSTHFTPSETAPNTAVWPRNAGNPPVPGPSNTLLPEASVSRAELSTTRNPCDPLTSAAARPGCTVIADWLTVTKESLTSMPRDIGPPSIVIMVSVIVIRDSVATIARN